MYITLTRYTILSFILGAMLGVFVYRYRHRDTSTKPDNLLHKYEKWFQGQNLKRIPLTMDYLRYGNDNNINTESQFLYNNVKMMCVLFVRERKNAAAANETWTQQCNERTFVYLQSETELKPSWHILCNVIRDIDTCFHWFLFVNDDTFAIPENVRRLVAPLDYKEGHYLGHVTYFWGVYYNAAQAGYLLSKGSIILLRKQFNYSKICATGRRFCKQEDYYLGKHLARLGVHPTDTRDRFGQTTFHGHSLADLLSPDTFSALQVTDYYTRSVFQSDKCCSPFAVTFQSTKAENMHFYNNFLYHLQIFNNGGPMGNVKRAYDPEYIEKVWRSSVSELRNETELFDGEMSADAYYELWKSVA